jgi:hypothetical protein
MHFIYLENTERFTRVISQGKVPYAGFQGSWRLGVLILVWSTE